MKEIETPKKEIERITLIAKDFHFLYETYAPMYGYETRDDTKEFNPSSANGMLMRAVVGEIYRNIKNGKYD